MKPYLLCSVQKTVIKFVLLLLLLLLLVLSCFGLLLSCCADVRLPVEGKACAYLQSQADRVQVEIDETTAKLAEVAAKLLLQLRQWQLPLCITLSCSGSRLHQP